MLDNRPERVRFAILVGVAVAAGATGSGLGAGLAEGSPIWGFAGAILFCAAGVLAILLGTVAFASRSTRQGLWKVLRRAFPMPPPHGPRP